MDDEVAQFSGDQDGPQDTGQQTTETNNPKFSDMNPSENTKTDAGETEADSAQDEETALSNPSDRRDETSRIEGDTASSHGSHHANFSNDNVTEDISSDHCIGESVSGHVSDQAVPIDSHVEADAKSDVTAPAANDEGESAFSNNCSPQRKSESDGNADNSSSKAARFGSCWSEALSHEKTAELDVFGDGSLRLSTLRRGAERDSRPQNGERVRFDYRVAIEVNGQWRTVVERYDVVAAIGDADVPFGIETALKFIESGALVHAYVASRFGYGSCGLPPAIPPNTDLLIEIEPHEVSPPVDWRRVDNLAKRAFIESKRHRAQFYESLGQLSCAAVCTYKANAVEAMVNSAAASLAGAENIANDQSAGMFECDDEHAEDQPQAEVEPVASVTDAAPVESPPTSTDQDNDNSGQNRVIVLLSGGVALIAFLAATWYRLRVGPGDATD